MIDCERFEQPTVAIVKFVREMLVMSNPTATDTNYAVLRLPRDKYSVLKAPQGWKPVVGLDREIHYQVTLCADKLSPSRGLIRMGDYPADEITGWQPVDTLELVEILGRLEFDAQANDGAGDWKVVPIPQEQRKAA